MSAGQGDSPKSLPQSNAAGQQQAEGWTAAMRRGDFPQAWEISDAILASRVASGEDCSHWPRHWQYVWRGQPLAGKRVLVRCYHGLGDTIQFVRFAAPLREIASRVIVWAQPELLPLVKEVAGVDQALPLHDGAPEVPFDADVEIMELPHALRISCASLPGPIPYLRPRNRANTPARSRPRIGLVWHAGDWDPRRSIPGPLLGKLKEVSGVELVSLQRGEARDQLRQIGIPDASSADVTETAVTTCGLDLVITVDTMVAHLAGALGRPVWTLLHADPDWRWMLDRSDSPWYPTMRLFRQQKAGDWGSVIQDVKTALAERFSLPTVASACV